jgi:hypothetical protein
MRDRCCAVLIDVLQIFCSGHPCLKRKRLTVCHEVCIFHDRTGLRLQLVSVRGSIRNAMGEHGARLSMRGGRLNHPIGASLTVLSTLYSDR